MASLLWGAGEISSRSYSAGQCFKCSAGDTSGGHQWRHQSPERRLQLLEIVDFVDHFWIGLELEARTNARVTSLFALLDDQKL